MPALAHPLFRKVGHNENIFAEPLTVEQVLQGKSDSELIQIDGQLVGYSQSNSDITLLLNSGANDFSAVLPKRLAGPNPTRMEGREQVSGYRGICSARMDTEGSAATEGIAEAESFAVLMRSPQDVTILESPSWWTSDASLALLALAVHHHSDCAWLGDGAQKGKWRGRQCFCAKVSSVSATWLCTIP